MHHGKTEVLKKDHHSIIDQNIQKTNFQFADLLESYNAMFMAATFHIDHVTVPEVCLLIIIRLIFFLNSIIIRLITNHET